MQACFLLMPLALGQGTSAMLFAHVRRALLGPCSPGAGWVTSAGSPSLPPARALEAALEAAAAVPLRRGHPCSFASVKALGKQPLGRAELGRRAFSPGFWEGRANNGALEPGKSCQSRWACRSWVQAGKASAALPC